MFRPVLPSKVVISISLGGKQAMALTAWLETTFRPLRCVVTYDWVGPLGASLGHLAEASLGCKGQSVAMSYKVFLASCLNHLKMPYLEANMWRRGIPEAEMVGPPDVCLEGRSCGNAQSLCVGLPSALALC